MKNTSARNGRKFAYVTLAVALGISLSMTGAGQANAYTSPVIVNLGNAQSFAVLASQTVTNTGTSTIGGDVGVSPGTAITGFPPGVITGAYGLHSNTAAAIAAMADLGAAYTDAAGRAPADETAHADLSGLTLAPGLYSGGALSNTGTLTLDGEGDANSVWIFQAASTLITSPNSTVMLIGDANPCNVFWQVGSSATLDTDSTFVGTVMAQTSIAANNGATIQGRLLALTGEVTLINNTVDAAVCAGTPAAGGTPVPGGGGTTPGGTTPGGPTLPATGVDAGPYGIAILTLIGAGVALLLFSNKSRKRMMGRRSK